MQRFLVCKYPCLRVIPSSFWFRNDITWKVSHANHKLYLLYLTDSIVKNVGGNYNKLFQDKLVSNFEEAFKAASVSVFSSFNKNQLNLVAKNSNLPKLFRAPKWRLNTFLNIDTKKCSFNTYSLIVFSITYFYIRSL